MENPTDNLNEPQPLTPESLTINTEIKNYLFETAKWGKFLGIIGFIGVGLMVLVGLGMGLFMDRSRSGMPPMTGMPGQFGGMFFTVLYLLMAVLYYFPSMYVYQFATKAKIALLGNNETELTLAFSRLKSFFKFWGILMVVALIFYALMLIFAVGMIAMTGLKY
jgi:magnesium-transporting ATPase (P-type)